MQYDECVLKQVSNQESMLQNLVKIFHFSQKTENVWTLSLLYFDNIETMNK